MSKEAMKLALEALYDIIPANANSEEIRRIQQKAITALREALAQQPAQQEPNGIEFLMRGDKMAVKIGVQQFTLDYEPVEPGEFEFMRDMLLKALSAFTPDVKTEKPVYTSPQPAQPQQEPVACGGEQEAPYIGHDCNPALPDSMKVFCPACCTKFRAIPAGVQKLMLDAGFEPPFTSPPAQEFVCSAGLCHYRKPLTDEEIENIAAQTLFPIDFARTIEAAHGIKENT